MCTYSGCADNCFWLIHWQCQALGPNTTRPLHCTKGQLPVPVCKGKPSEKLAAKARMNIIGAIH